MPENVRAVITPFAFQLHLAFGYLVFALAWVVIFYAVMCFLLDAEFIVKFGGAAMAINGEKAAMRSRNIKSGDARSARVIQFPAREREAVMR